MPQLKIFFQQHYIIKQDKVLVKIRDTAGAQEYADLRESYIRDSDCFILVYCITNRNSFDALDTFVHQIFKIKKCARIPMVVVGNKLDLEEGRDVSSDEGQAFANTLDASFMETSAKTRYNVDELFTEAARRAMCASLDFKFVIPYLTRDKQSRRKTECSMM